MSKARVIRSTAVVGGFTAFSRILGLTRDILMASYFGTSIYMSAFVVAFTIPNLFRRLFGEGALSAAFVPVFVESRHKDGDAQAWIMVKEVVTLLASILILISVVGIIAVTIIMNSATLGEKATLVLPLLRIMLPYMIFICLAALFMAILNSYHHFAVPAFAPCLLNVVWIIAVLFICPRFKGNPAAQIGIVAWAVIIAGVLQFGVQLPTLYKFGFRPGISFNWDDPRVVKMLTLMGPAALGLAVTQFNVVIDRLLAIWIGDWAPAALFFSERLIYFPLGVFAIALSTVLLPTFSKHMAATETEKVKDTLNHALRNLLFVMIPAAVGLAVLARPIVEMIFQYGNFTARSTELTTIALQFYAPGLIVFSLAKVFVPAFYSMQDTKTPVKIGVYTVLLNVTLNVIFVLTWPLYMKHAGLACATVLAESFYAIVLAVLLHRRLGSPGWSQIMRSFSISGICAVIMALAAVILYSQLTLYTAHLTMNAKILHIFKVLISIGGAMAFYFLSALLLKAEEIQALLQSLRKKRIS